MVGQAVIRLRRGAVSARWRSAVSVGLMVETRTIAPGSLLPNASMVLRRIASSPRFLFPTFAITAIFTRFEGPPVIRKPFADLVRLSYSRPQTGIAAVRLMSEGYIGRTHSSAYGPLETR